MPVQEMIVISDSGPQRTSNAMRKCTITNLPTRFVQFACLAELHSVNIAPKLSPNRISFAIMSFSLICLPGPSPTCAFTKDAVGHSL